MMLKRKIIVVALLAVSGAVFANDVELMGTVTQTVRVSPQRMGASVGVDKTIPLLAIKLSETAQTTFADRPQTEDLSAASYLEGGLPNAKQLGMNSLPVLDQGMHGTCVTFAVTAALDAAMGGKDEISQLCQLELGNYLEQQGYNPSGWDGAFGHAVLNQIESFGVVSKSQQQSQGCGGLTAYPGTSSTTPTAMMTPEAFHSMSKEVKRSSWYPILQVSEAFTSKVDTQKTLTSVKTALGAGDRVTFGTLLVALNQGVAGAVGTYHAKNDTWVLTAKIKEMLQHEPDFAGHEMVITGYDDEATVVDAEGLSHKGLLTLRNSWGSQIGDQGNFYMSYEYFKQMVIEAHRIHTK